MTIRRESMMFMRPRSIRNMYSSLKEWIEKTYSEHEIDWRVVMDDDEMRSYSSPMPNDNTKLHDDTAIIPSSPPPANYSVEVDNHDSHDHPNNEEEVIGDEFLQYSFNSS